MTELSGLVAVLNEAMDEVVEVRDLGRTPTAVKHGRVRQLVDHVPELEPGYELGAPSYAIGPAVVTRTWSIEKIALPELAPYQFRAMLQLSGKGQQLTAVLDGLSEPTKTIALAKLEYSLTFRRDNDLVEQARQAMGLTTDALDKLWQQAAAIE